MRAPVKNPGALSHRVELQKRENTADGLGGQFVSWTTQAFLWARVVPGNQIERDVGDHLESAITHQVHIRFRDGVEPGMRFFHRSRALRILSCIDMDESQRFLTCLCEEEK